MERNKIERNKICPLTVVETDARCHKECAWWLEEEEECAIIVLAKLMIKRLRRLNEK